MTPALLGISGEMTPMDLISGPDIRSNGMVGSGFAQPAIAKSVAAVAAIRRNDDIMNPIFCHYG